MFRFDIRPLYIALAYAVFGVVWILGSDQAVESLVPKIAEVTWVQTIKGIGFVLISATFILLMMLDQSRRYRHARGRLVSRIHDLHRLTGQFVEMQEWERRELSAELHNEIGQILALLRLNIAEALKTSDSQAQASALELIDELIVMVRRLAEGLHSTVLTEKGLEEALNWLVERHRQFSGKDIHLECRVKRDQIDRGVELSAFRIVQEAINNAVKHAGASTIEIHVEHQPEALRLRVADNGGGFAATSSAAPRGDEASSGLGLALMREYALLAGGKLDIDSRLGSGTKIDATLPLNGVPLRTGMLAGIS